MTDLANLKALCVAASRPMPRKRRAGWWRDQGAFQDAANPAAILDLIERVERAEGRCAWMDTAAKVLAGYERDLGESLDDMHELGRIDESRDCPSFRIRVGHIRPSAPPPPISEGSE